MPAADVAAHYENRTGLRTPIEGKDISPVALFFSLANLVSVVFTIVVLSALHHDAERKQLLDIGQSNHVALTQTLGNALGPQFRDLAKLAQTLDNEALRQHADITALQPRVIEAMRNTQVVKLKLYDLN